MKGTPLIRITISSSLWDWEWGMKATYSSTYEKSLDRARYSREHHVTSPSCGCYYGRGFKGNRSLSLTGAPSPYTHQTPCSHIGKHCVIADDNKRKVVFHGNRSYKFVSTALRQYSQMIMFIISMVINDSICVIYAQEAENC